MTTALVWFAVALGALVGMVVAMTLVGYGLPRQHVVTRTRTLPVDPPTAWAALVDFPGQVAWRRGLTAIDRLPDADGAEVWREQSGRRAVAFRTVIADPPTRLVRQVDNQRGPFRGRWEFAVEPGPGPGRCRVTLTEFGEVANPLFRYLTRFMIGQATSVERYLADLERKFAVL